MPAGNDISSSNATWDEATAYCNKTGACQGFTFQGGGNRKPTSPVKVYFKSAATVNSDGGWTSWVKGSSGRPPKWSQGYQSAVVTADISAILENDRASGIAVWQFNDVKAVRA